MSILIVTPAARGSRAGNRVTAERWGSLLRSLDEEVAIRSQYRGESAEILVALHARKSGQAVRQYRQKFANRRIILTLTGTDLYHDLEHDPFARGSLSLADRIVVLQPDAIRHVPDTARRRTRVIIQSAKPITAAAPPSTKRFEICVVGHLRTVKDPFRAAYAVRHVPAHSTLHVIHIGEALTAGMQPRAEAEMERNPRYEWLGGKSHREVQQRLARCRLLVVSSKLEGGANVISEALAAGVPVVSSRISGSLGLLGDGYPGYFEVGDTKGLRSLLLKCEQDKSFYRQLAEAAQRRRPLIEPARERNEWKALLDEVRSCR